MVKQHPGGLDAGDAGRGCGDGIRGRAAKPVPVWRRRGEMRNTDPATPTRCGGLIPSDDTASRSLVETHRPQLPVMARLVRRGADRAGPLAPVSWPALSDCVETLFHPRPHVATPPPDAACLALRPGAASAPGSRRS